MSITHFTGLPRYLAYSRNGVPPNSIQQRVTPRKEEFSFLAANKKLSDKLQSSVTIRGSGFTIVIGLGFTIFVYQRSCKKRYLDMPIINVDPFIIYLNNPHLKY